MKRVREGVLGLETSGSPRVPKECTPESEESPRRVQSCVFGLFSDSGVHSLWTLGAPGAPEAPGHPCGRFFWDLGPKGPGDLCAGPGVPKAQCHRNRAILRLRIANFHDFRHCLNQKKCCDGGEWLGRLRVAPPWKPLLRVPESGPLLCEDVRCVVRYYMVCVRSMLYCQVCPGLMF